MGQEDQRNSLIGYPSPVFTHHELVDLARGARALAFQSRKDRDGQRNPTLKAQFETAAVYYDELADKCERLAKTKA